MCLADDREVRELVTTGNTSRFLGISHRLDSSSCFNNQEVEKQEVSTQLKVLKQTYNRQNSKYMQKEQQAFTLSQEKAQISLVNSRRVKSFQKLLGTLKDLESKYQRTKARQLEEISKQNTYLSIIHRTNETLVKFRSEARVLKNDLRVKTWDKERLHTRQRLTSEKLVQSKVAIKNLQKEIGKEKGDLEYDISKIGKDLKRRKMIDSRRTERMVQSARIHEKAIVEHESKASEMLKERVLLHKLWFRIRHKAFLRTQFECAQLNTAFNKI